jgi:citrate synthase
MKIYKGLEGVLADTSAISLVDGVQGELSYRGYTIGSLVDSRSPPWRRLSRSITTIPTSAHD